MNGERAGMAPETVPETVAEMRREIGRDLGDRRRNARLTQHELAVKAGYHRSVVGHAEQGRGDAGPAFWARADTALGTGAHFTAWDTRIRAAAARPAAARPGDGELEVPAELTGPDPEAALAASRRSGWPVRGRPDGLVLVTGDVVDVCEVPARAGRVAVRWWHETGGRADVVRGLPALPPPGTHLAVLDAGERWLFLVRGGACPWDRDAVLARWRDATAAARPDATAAGRPDAVVGWHVPGNPVPVPPAPGGGVRWAILPSGRLLLAPPLATAHLLARAVAVTRDPAALVLGDQSPDASAVKVVPVFSGEGD